MSIVDKELERLADKSDAVALVKLVVLANELEQYCEEMRTALGPQSWARKGYEKWKQERTR